MKPLMFIMKESPLNDSVKGTYAGLKEGKSTKIKRKLHIDSSSFDFFVDKVIKSECFCFDLICISFLVPIHLLPHILGDKIRKELTKSKAKIQVS